MKLVLAGVVALLLITGRPAQAQQEEAEGRARTFFAVGKYQEALEIYGKLFADTLHPTYLRNIGRCHQMMADPDRAINSFREYLRKSKTINAEERAEVNGFIREMEALRNQREADRAAARSRSQASNPSPEPRVTVQMPPEGGDQPEPPPPSRSSGALGWGLVVGGAAVGLAGGALMLVQAGKASEARARNDPAAYEAASTPWKVGLGGAIVGVAAMVVGAVVLISDGEEPPPRRTALRASPWFGRDGAGLQLGATW